MNKKGIEIDKRVRPMVEFFNSIGLHTKQSCSGHFHWDGAQSLFWISFDSTITETNIVDFYNKVKPINGWFVQRLFPGPKYNIHHWCYVVGNSRAARQDLKNWKSKSSKI